MSENANGNGNGTHGILTREALFKARKDREVVPTDIEGWGKVGIRKLTLRQLKEFEKAPDNYVRAKMLILHSIVDGDAKPMFESIEELDDLEMPLFKALSDAVSDVNAMKVDEGKIKNSETAKTLASS